MKLTRASSYAIHAVAFMAAQKSDRPVASHNIAQARGIPERFLLKVLKPLVSARVLTSIKGPHGGYRLAKPAHEISMLEILEAVEGPIGVQPPSFSRPDGDGPLSANLERVCRATAEQTRQTLERVKIADLALKGKLAIN